MVERALAPDWATVFDYAVHELSGLAFEFQQNNQKHV